MKTFGSSVIISGTSQSAGLSSGFEDMFIISCQVNTAQINWIKYIGTSSFPEFGGSLAITPSGNIWSIGTIRALTYSNGDQDLFIT